MQVITDVICNRFQTFQRLEHFLMYFFTKLDLKRKKKKKNFNDKKTLKNFKKTITIM